jgi:hypothetical protein
MRLRRAIALSTALGVAVPALIEAIFHLMPYNLELEILLEDIALILWPSSIMLIAFDNARGFVVLEALALTIGINVVLYVVIGSLVWSLIVLLRRWITGGRTAA